MIEHGEGTLYFDVAGQSMWPFLRGVERVVVRPVKIADLRRGDLVVFRRDGRVVCHRFAGVIRRHGQDFLSARPDTTWRPVDFFDAANLFGRVVGIASSQRLRPWTGFGARLADIFFYWCGPFFRVLR